MNRFNLILPAIKRNLINLGLVMALIHSPQLAAFGDDTTIGMDSEIRLMEYPGDAPYRSLTIMLRSNNGMAELMIAKDDERNSKEIPSDAYLDLFQNLLKLGSPQLENQFAGPDSPSSPGHSRFMVLLREGAESHEWLADGVDDLMDTSYRDIVGLIMMTADRLMENGDGIPGVNNGNIPQ
ncbi:MAG: hypothetical protein ACU833_00220 [Gammaproteobacteria bacterium]